jgi:hypothetical protein
MKAEFTDVVTPEFDTLVFHRFSQVALTRLTVCEHGDIQLLLNGG